MKRLFPALMCLAAMMIVLAGIFYPFDSKVEVVKLEVVDAYGDTWEGTGFFVADDLIMTAGHMVDGAKSVTIVYSNGDKRTGYDWYQESPSMTDVGLIRVKTPEREPAIKLVDCKVGDKIIAIGDPYGHFPVTTRGYVSGVNIYDVYFGQKALFLADVALNPGNSGCPLIGNGGVVGICVGGIEPANNMCFCVPANILRLVLDKYLVTAALQEAE